LNRGEGLPPTKDFSRESLYVNFDPLVQHQPLYVPEAENNIKQIKVETAIVEEVENDVETEPEIVEEVDNHVEQIKTHKEMIEEAENDINKIKAETEIAKEDLNDVETAFAEVLL
jgi:uncharacterized protein (DUF342 family)